jgi:hypothetical protein
MATRRVMRSVLHNFLGTLTSRHSDYQGYWLFGQLPANVEALEVNLLDDPPDGEALVQVVERVAIRRFSEQLLKARLDRSFVCEATLLLTRDQEPVLGWHGELQSLGHDLDFKVRVRMDSNRVLEDRQVAFAAPHDPRSVAVLRETGVPSQPTQGRTIRNAMEVARFFP